VPNPTTAYLDQRLQRLGALLAQEDLDAILISNPVNVSYLTGFSGESSYLVIGRNRVTHLRLHTAQAHVDVPCDAVVLAADPRPSRNVEGALTPGAPAVTFHQPLRPYDANARYEHAVRSARAWLEGNAEVP